LSTYLWAATAALAVLQQVLYADTYVLRDACCNVTHCRAQAFIKDEVETYVPAGNDLAYPSKLEAAAAKAAAAAAAGEITEDAGEDADGAQVGSGHRVVSRALTPLVSAAPRVKLAQVFNARR
jgi:hypothetical protein